MTKLPKWTPGPWEIVEEDKRLDISHGAYTHAEVPFDYNESESDARQLANAHLIAAAPDLYEALVEVITWVENWEPSFTEDDEWDETVERIKAALARARGER